MQSFSSGNQSNSAAAPASASSSAAVVSVVIADGVESAQKQNLKKAVKVLDHASDSSGLLGKHILNRFKFLFWGANFAGRNQFAEFQSTSSGQRALCAGLGATTQLVTGTVADAKLLTTSVALAATGPAGFVGGTLLLSGGMPLVDAGSEWIGDKTQQSCHKAFDFFNPSADSAVQKKQQGLAELIKREAYSPKQAIQKDLDKQLQAILGEKEDKAIDYVKKQVLHFRSLQSTVKDLAQQYKAVSQDKKSATVNREQYRQSLQSFIQLSAASANICSTLGQLTNNPELQKVGRGIGSIVQIASAIPAIFSAGASLAVVNPILGVAAGVVALSGLLNDNEEDNGMAEMLQQVTQAILQPLYAMWSEFRHEFRVLHAEIHTVMDMLFSLTNLTRDQYRAVIARLDALQSSLMDAKFVIHEAVRDAHLENPYQILSNMSLRLNDPVGKSCEKTPQTLNNELYHWVQAQGGLCRGLHTGLHEFKAINVSTEAGFNKIKDIITNPELLNDRIGFLAEVAKHISPSEELQKINTTTLFNPDLWCGFANAYMLFRNQFINDVTDKDHYQLSRVMQAGAEFLKFIELIQNHAGHTLFVALFKGYQSALNEIQYIIDQAIKIENGVISEAMEKAYPTPKDSKEEKVSVDISQDVTTIINGFKEKMPLQHKVNLNSERYKGDNYKVNYDLPYASIDSKDIEKVIHPELIFLARLGIQEFVMSASADRDHNDFHVYIHLKIEGKTEQVLRLKYKVKPQLHWTADIPVAWNAINQRQPDECAVAANNLINELQIKAREKIINYLQQRRKAVEETYNKAENKPDNKAENTIPIESAFNKLDSYLKLLHAYAHLAGFQNSEIQELNKLCNSEQIKAKMQAYADDKTLATVSPHTNLVPEFTSARYSILSKFAYPQENYFQSIYAQRVELTLVALVSLAQRNFVKPSAVLSYKAIEQLLKEYSELFRDQWQEVWVVEWFNKLPEKAKQKKMYQDCKQTINDAEEKLKILEADMKKSGIVAHEIIAKIIELKAVFIKIHSYFKSLNLLVGGGEKYTITDDDVRNLLFNDARYDEKVLSAVQSVGEDSSNKQSHDEKSAKPSVISRLLPNNPESYYEVDVTGDGSCLPYSVTLGYLLPVLNDEKQFSHRCSALFGQDKTTNAAIADVKKFLQSYRGEKDFITTDHAALEVLVDTNFRHKFIQHMRDHKAEFKDFIVNDFEAYVASQVRPKQWCGDHELKAISAILQIRIEVYSPIVGSQLAAPKQIHGANFSEIIRLVHADGGTHYHYLIQSKFLKLPQSAAAVMPAATPDASAAAVAIGNDQKANNNRAADQKKHMAKDSPLNAGAAVAVLANNSSPNDLNSPWQIVNNENTSTPKPSS